MTEGRYSGSRFQRAVVVFLAGRAVQGVANMLQLLWLVRLLPVTEYGGYVTVLGLVELLVPLASFGTLDAVRCYVPRLAGSATATRTLVGRLVRARALAVVTVMAILLLFWAPLTTMFHFPLKLQHATRSAALLIGAVLAFRLFAEILEALFEQRHSQTLRALLPIGKLLLIAGCMLSATPITLPVMMVIELFVTLGCLVLAVVSLQRTLAGLPRGHADLPDVAELTRFQRHMTIVEWTNAMAGIGAIRLIVAGQLGLEVAALFGFLHGLQQTVARYLPATLLTNLIQPVLVSRYQAGQDNSFLNDAGNLLVKINWLVIGAMAVATATGGDKVIGLLSGGKFTSGSQTLLLLILTLIPAASRMAITLLLQIVSLTKVLRTMAMAPPLLMIALIWMSNYGQDALAATLFVFAGIWNITTLSLAHRSGFTFIPDWGAVVRLTLACLLSVCFGIAFMRIAPSSALNTIVGTMISTGLALMLMLVSRPLRKAELTLVERVIHRSLPGWLSRV